MNAIGFTGTTRGMTPFQTEALVELLKVLKKNVSMAFNNGMAMGADTEAARIAGNLGYYLVGYPGKASLDSYRGVEHDETYAPDDNLTRNRKIVDHSAIMVAVPFGDGEVLRSGTWETIRYARQMKKPMFVIWPDGAVEKYYLEGASE